jgi:hypothetical protein
MEVGISITMDLKFTYSRGGETLASASVALCVHPHPEIYGYPQKI